MLCSDDNKAVTTNFHSQFLVCYDAIHTVALPGTKKKNNPILFIHETVLKESYHR